MVFSFNTSLFYSLIFTVLFSTITVAETQSFIKEYLPDLRQKTSTSTSTQTAPKKTSKPIGTISITGSKTFETNKIIEISKLKKGSTSTKLSLSRAKRNITNLGIFKKVTLNTKEKKDKIDISITLVENPIVSEVIIDGNTTLTQEYLTHHLKSTPNSPYNLSHIRNDIKFLEKAYEELGFLEAKVYNIERPKTSNSPLIFYVGEGVIDDISITGNIKTQDYVILRELDLRPGDKLTRKHLRSNIRKVFNLSYFNDIQPSIIPSETPNKYLLKLNIVEKETSGAFTLGGGYAPNSGFNFFSDLYWDNIMGSGQLIMLKGNFGLGVGGFDNSNSTYQFKYHNPWAFGERRSFTFKTWTTSGSFSAFDFGSQDFSFQSQKRRGVEVGIGIPHTYDIRSHHNIKYESVSLDTTNLSYNIYSYKFNLSIDKRDQNQNPREGYYHNISIEQAFKFRMKAIDFTQADLTLRKFFPIGKKQTLALKSSFGYIRSPEINNEDLFVAQYYYVGGSRTVRGYADNDPFAYGNSQVLSTLEYRYIISPTITVYSFVDIGFANQETLDDNSIVKHDITDFKEYKISKGVGLKFVVAPLGPIKLDFGITETGIGRLQVNLGYSF
ncbi:hypothetical protein DID78_05540 [Candidatus Marinamargulisbacteria bacterium SCGC AG-343-D04]|nr:hypothetical protein DID78_05540 [Candidatus Marinamargulisbacteria bacterium SCGC AG-343-D04]